MSKKCLWRVSFLALLTSIIGQSVWSDEKALSGGQTTVINQSREAFAKPAANLEIKQLRNFTFGNRVFNTKWVTAPASVQSFDGLGPLFNQRSCSACHFKDGRGRPPLRVDESLSSMLIRLSVVDAQGKVVPHPAYGARDQR